MIFGIFSILIPLIGIVLGIIGLVLGRKSLQQMVESQEDGRGLAVGGIVCSSIGLVLQIFVVIGILSFTLLIESTPG